MQGADCTICQSEGLGEVEQSTHLSSSEPPIDLSNVSIYPRLIQPECNVPKH
jgi:hypothetical protein